MALLKSVNNVPGIDYYEYRDSQFYNKYDYRMRVKIPHVRYTWWCNTEDELDNKIGGKTRKYGSIRKDDLPEVKQHIQALKTVIRLQAARKKDKNLGVRIEHETIAFFSNDLQALKNIESQFGPNYKCDFTQVQTSQYSGVKYFTKEPKHKFRVYLRTKRVEDNFHVDFRDTIKRQSSLHPSSALSRWLSNDGKRYGIWYFRWTSAAHFIDYDDESTLSYLALMHGDILGKKYKLEKRPDNI